MLVRAPRHTTQHDCYTSNQRAKRAHAAASHVLKSSTPRRYSPPTSLVRPTPRSRPPHATRCTRLSASSAISLCAPRSLVAPHVTLHTVAQAPSGATGPPLKRGGPTLRGLVGEWPHTRDPRLGQTPPAHRTRTPNLTTQHHTTTCTPHTSQGPTHKSPRGSHRLATVVA